MMIDRKVVSDLAVVATVTMLSAALRALVPMNLLYNGKYDDALMVNMSQQFRFSETQWTSMSMMKSIGYPLILRASLELKVSPVLITHLMYLAGAMFLAWRLRTRVHRLIWTTMTIGMAFNPVLFGTTASRVYRDVATMAVALAFVATTMVLCEAKSSDRRKRFHLLIHGCVLVVLSSILCLIRNDALWVILFLPLTGLTLVIANWKSSRRPGLLLCIFGVLVTVLSPKAAEIVGAKINEKRFGVELADDFYYGWFPRLITQWSAVDEATSRPFTPVSRSQRESTYPYSPTLNRLADSLEGSISDGWRSISCQATSGEVCDDIAGGYFPFALREAIEGVYEPRNELEFQAVFEKSTIEIAAACSSRLLVCNDSGLNVFLPAANEIDVKSSAKIFADYMFTRVFRFRDQLKFDAVPPVDGDTKETVDNWTEIIESSNGQKTSTVSGTPSVLRTPLRYVLTLFSYFLTMWAFLGVVGGIFSLNRRSLFDQRAWGVLTHLAICCVYVAIHSIVGANSFGPMIYDGNKEMSYLVQPTPFVIVAAAFGWSIILDKTTRGRARQESKK